MLVVGIGGCTCAGKTTVSKLVQSLLAKHGLKPVYFNQDVYYKEPEEIEPIAEFDHYRYDDPEAVRWSSMYEEIKQTLDDAPKSQNDSSTASSSLSTTVSQVCLVEGNMIFLNDAVDQLFAKRYFLTLDYEECRRRRALRTDYIPPDTKQYFEGYVWPAYMKHMQHMQSSPHLDHTTFIDGATASPELTANRITGEILRHLHPKHWIHLQTETLNLELATQYVTDPTNGAISVFMGTTRDNFDNKRVVRLEYEAYDDMAKQKMAAVCEQAQQKWPDIGRCALMHRLGLVDVCESSVIVAVGSPHRRDAQEACMWMIDELKRKVPIWKKEIYDDHSGDWKQNKESDWVKGKAG